MSMAVARLASFANMQREALVSFRALRWSRRDRHGTLMGA